MSPFKEKVIQIVQSIPEGKVVSYGQVAAYCGLPRAAREVGWTLNGIEEDAKGLPWWRVVNNKGYLSIRGNRTADKELQAKLLRSEGIEVSSDYSLPIETYRYLPSFAVLKAFQLEDTYINLLLTKYSSQTSIL